MKTRTTKHNPRALHIAAGTTNGREKATIGRRRRIASLLLMLPFLVTLAIQASADCTGTQLYSNDGTLGDHDAFTISFVRPGQGYAVSDSFTVYGGAVNCFTFLVWEWPGDSISSVYWSMDSNYGGTGTTANPNMHDASGIALGAQISQKFVTPNAYGYDLDLITVSVPTTSLAPGQHFLTLSFGMTAQNYPLYWDDCANGWGGCTSLAYQQAGSWGPLTESETFAVYGP